MAFSGTLKVALVHLDVGPPDVALRVALPYTYISFFLLNFPEFHQATLVNLPDRVLVIINATIGTLAIKVSITACGSITGSVGQQKTKDDYAKLGRHLMNCKGFFFENCAVPL